GAAGGSGGAAGGSGGASGGSGGSTGGAGGAMGGSGGSAGGSPDVAVYRVGDGSAGGAGLVNTGNPVFLDEWSPTGALVKTTAIPTTASGSNKPLIASGTATSEGLITRSSDTHYILLTGYGTTLGGSTSLSGSSLPRVVGRVDASGNVDTSTAPSDFASGNNPRTAASTDGTNIWIAGGAGGVRYTTLGTTGTSTQLSTTLTNIRQTSIFAGQLYISTGSGSSIRIGPVGAGLPTTSGQTITTLPGIPTASASSPYQFFMADLDGVAGLDTIYVTDDATSGTTGGLTKYSLVSGTWTSNGVVGAGGDGYRGVTGVVNGATVTLFAVRKGGSTASGGGELVSITDANGFNASFSSTPTLLATAAANTAFRGVALAPQ
ncbi:MAG TPA: hypothetical protein VHJ20_13700, partial [Polyangia bacterium]|nr:hypothetical protein [Polyangia bacterium]